MTEKNLKARLLWSSPDKRGLVSHISQLIFELGGNIIDLDVHVDGSAEMFFLRLELDMSRIKSSPDKFKEAFQPLIKECRADCQIKINKSKPRLAILVSKYEHCLQEILWRYEMGELEIDIPLIISNHPDLGYLADRYKIPFFVFAKTPETKFEQEAKEIDLLKQEKIDTVVLARYMQVLSPQFVKAYPNQILNIHHSFLPAFIGGSPYKQAFERGVKIVGATCHYVTDMLDEGQIIEQDIIRISHKDSVDDLIRKGRDLERLVLAKGLIYHFEDRILVHGKKTIVFD